MIKISPNNIEFIAKDWVSILARGNIDVFYILLKASTENKPLGEYYATISMLGNEIKYRLNGHGIGSTEKVCDSAADLFTHILNDNNRFNSGGEFYFQLPN